MYLEEFTLENFRKFKDKNNKIQFVNYSEDHSNGKQENKETSKKEVNVASITTLIIGKNNSGKTTIMHALDKLINKSEKIGINDFNYSYLIQLFEEYRKTVFEENNKISLPYIKFKLTINIEDIDESNDIITNLRPVVTISDIKKSRITFDIKIEMAEEEIFIENLKLYFLTNKNITFSSFLEILSKEKLQMNYYSKSGIKIRNFELNNLIQLEFIQANNLEKNSSLSKAFNEIIKHSYKQQIEENNDNDLINQLNELITDEVQRSHTIDVNETLHHIESQEKLQVSLSSDVTLQKIMNNLIKYEYVENGLQIPESQFGLGYTNLMMIIAKLIEYTEKQPEDSFRSKINIISIEEPETFMHPQMQELFIKHINDAVNFLLDKKKTVHSQLMVTTHSSHILNSKIHSGNSFDNINYITTIEKAGYIVNLSDENVIKTDNDNGLSKLEELTFLKKHIKYKVSELFFSDGVIIVEGISEEVLLKYFIEKNVDLNKYYIPIFTIDGAHAHMYIDLLHLLKVPTLIITDLDIKRSKEEKEKLFNQVTSLNGETTTNKTIEKFNNDSNSLENYPSEMMSENIKVISQVEPIQKYYATSFEEALILTNYNNELLNETLKKVKPEIYKNILGNEVTVENNKKYSFKWQQKLSSGKSEFANTLLFNILKNDENSFSLPKYINNGLEWLSNELKKG